MTPTTPPRSRERRTSIVNESIVSESEIIPPATPYRSLQGRPVTPSTTTRKSHKELELMGPQLVVPRERSPFKGFQSPEFTPLREPKKQDGEDLQRVSRVLFPKTSKEESLRESFSSTTTELLPPTREGTFNEAAVSKQLKWVPGTPSHRLTNFELAKKWHNDTGKIDDKNYDDNDGDDDEVLIRQVDPKNPFQSCDAISRETRNERLQSLLQNNPDVGDVITYVNKDGGVVKRHRLSKTEKEAFKPKCLFAKELQELESENQAEGEFR